MEKFSNVYLLGLDDNLKNSQWTAKSFEVRGEKIQFIAWSFSTLHYRESPFLNFDDSLVDGDAIVVGLNHGEIGRDEGLYAPMQLHEFSPLAQIWLVGHIHKPDIFTIDNSCVLYTGSPQALSAKETGKHGPFLITIHSKNNIEKEQILLSPVRYETVSIDVSDAEDVDSFNNIITNELEAFAEEIQEELEHVSFLVCDVDITGTHGDIQDVEKWAENITDISLSVNYGQTSLTVRKKNLSLEATIENLEDLAKSNNSVGIIANTLLLLQKGELNDFSEKILDKWEQEKSQIESASAYTGLRNAQRIELPPEKITYDFLKKNLTAFYHILSIKNNNRMKDKNTFLVQKLHINKSPGFPRGLLPFENAKRHINIIYGPNASGKSTTARMIQQLIWKRADNNIHIEGNISCNDENYTIHQAFNDYTITNRHTGEKQEELINIPSQESRTRYMLELSDLLKSEEGDLAKEILQISNGGYDLDAVKNDFGYNSQAISASRNVVKNYNDASRKHKESLQKQEDVQRDEKKLQELTIEIEKAKSAADKKGFLENLIELILLKAKGKNLEEQKSQHPKAIEKVLPNDFEDLERLEKEIEVNDKKILDLQKEIENREEEIKKLNINPDSIDVSILDEQAGKIKDLEDKIQQAKEKKAAKEKIRESRFAALSEIETPEEWEGVNTNTFKGLEDFVQASNQLLYDKAKLSTNINTLESTQKQLKENQTESVNKDSVQEGIYTLSNWLKAQNGEVSKKYKPVIKWLFPGIAALVIVFAFILQSYSIWILLIGIITVSIGLFLSTSSKSKGKKLTVLKQGFNDLKLGALEDWTSEMVVERLEKLIKTLENLTKLELTEIELNRKNDEFTHLNNELEKLIEQQQEWINKLGFQPKLFDKNNLNPNSFQFFLTHLIAWYEADSEVQTSQKNIEGYKQQLKSKIDTLNERLQDLNIEVCEDAITAKERVNLIKGKVEKHKELTGKNEISQTNLDNLISNKKDAEKNKTEIFNRLQIDNQNKEEVRYLVENSSEYQDIINELNINEREKRKTLSSLQTYSLYTKYEHRIDDLKLDKLQNELSVAEEDAEQYESLRDKRTQITERIEIHKKGSDVADALANVDKTLEDLENAFHENLTAMTGDVIIEALKKETEQKNQPEIFKKANDILNQITYGRYELRIGQSNSTVEFKAFDTKLDLLQSLEELSSGTRVQLLLAIRLAYIENIEKNNIKLPLLVDELLANSDDARAKAIIEALIEISKQGRQIFYFTAQIDEVAKWKHYLEKNKDLQAHVFKLGPKELQTDISTVELAYQDFNMLIDVPQARNNNYDDYRKQLGIGSFDIVNQSISEIHLWYLLEDNETLYNALRTSINSWGQLENHYKKYTIEGIDTALFQTIKEKATALKYFQELYSQGRSKKINPTILADSGLITPTFTDRINNYLIDVDYDAKTLIEGLKDKAVLRFTKGGELEDFLIDKGYIDTREQLSEEEIRSEMHGLTKEMKLNIEEINELIKRVIKG